MAESQVLFRVDANKQIGTGPFYRCLYIARMLKAKGAISVFFMADADKTIFEILKTEGLGLVDVPNDQKFTARFLYEYSLISNVKKSLLVVDCPYPDFYRQSFQEAISRRAGRVMMITFRNESRFKADIVHNQNLFALTEKYSAEPHTHLLLGPEYIILDERYLTLRHNNRDARNKVETFFVFFGGVDGSGLTLKVLRALTMLEERPGKIITVVGALYSMERELRTLLHHHPELPVELHVNTSNMPLLMAEADLAITSGGMSIWELACLGIPDIIISTSEREKVHTPLLDQRGTCLYVGHYDEVSEKQITDSVEKLAGDRQQREAMSKAAMNVVDGSGTQKVVQHMMELLVREHS